MERRQCAAVASMARRVRRIVVRSLWSLVWNSDAPAPLLAGEGSDVSVCHLRDLALT